MAKVLDLDKFKKEWFNFEEIENIKRGLANIEKGKILSHEEVKLLARNKIFSKSKVYV